MHLFVLLFCLDCNPGDYRVSRSKINKGVPLLGFQDRFLVR